MARKRIVSHGIRSLELRVGDLVRVNEKYVKISEQNGVRKPFSQGILYTIQSVGVCEYHQDHQDPMVSVVNDSHELKQYNPAWFIKITKAEMESGQYRTQIIINPLSAPPWFII